MNANKLTYIILLTGALVIVILTIRYVRNLKQPSSGSCDVLKDSDPAVKWSKNCSYISEEQPDSTLTQPTKSLYLDSFTSSPSLGPAWGGIYVWYKYVYVNGKTGGYSSPSPWTLLPITSGSTSLPCKNNNCGNIKFSGKDSCNSNLPTLKIDSLDYNFKNSPNIYTNIHRFVGTDSTPPDDSVNGVIVGMIIPNATGGGIFIDISTNPCQNANCSTPKGC